MDLVAGLEGNGAIPVEFQLIRPSRIVWQGIRPEEEHRLDETSPDARRHRPSLAEETDISRHLPASAVGETDDNDRSRTDEDMGTPLAKREWIALGSDKRDVR
jgi:hypothetical protein